MPRGYRRRYRGYRSAKSRYSNETAIITHNQTTTLDAGDTFPKGVIEEKSYVGYPVVPSTSTYGTRKAKNFEISLTSDALSQPLVCALVYVPQGTLASDFNVTTPTLDKVSSLYEPNQNVICQFVIPANGTSNSPQITKVKTRLARNLDSGDQIVMIFAPIGPISTAFALGATVNYAIKY